MEETRGDPVEDRETQPQRSIDRSTGYAVPRTVRWTSGVNILAGAWLVIAAFLLDYGDVSGAMVNAIVVGLIVLVAAAYRTANPGKASALSWINAFLGLWLIVAPFAFRYSGTAPATNDIIVGLVVLAMASVSAVVGQRLIAS